MNTLRSEFKIGVLVVAGIVLLQLYSLYASMIVLYGAEIDHATELLRRGELET